MILGNSKSGNESLGDKKLQTASKPEERKVVPTKKMKRPLCQISKRLGR